MEGIGRLDVKRLQMLREAARTGSFAAAGEILAYTPSAISQQMASLERDVGAILFERSPRGVTLTAAGRALLTHAERALDQLVAAQAELAAMAELRAGQLRVGSFTSATTAFVTAAVQAFRGRYPGVEVHFADGEPYESLGRLRAAQLDLAVIFELDHWPAGLSYDGVPLSTDEGLDVLDLFDDPFRLVCPRDHPLADAPSVVLDQLGGERILASPPWARDLATACRRAGIEIEIDSSHRATGFEAFQSFVAAGRGLTLIPALALGWKRRDLAAIRVEGDPVVRHVKAATPAGTSTYPATQAMLGLLREGVEGWLAGGEVPESLPNRARRLPSSRLPAGAGGPAAGRAA